jgi:hypothetical protein
VSTGLEISVYVARNSTLENLGGLNFWPAWALAAMVRAVRFIPAARRADPEG